MFNLFKKRCPICKMELKKEKERIKGFGKEFCSEECREEYRKAMAKEQSSSAKHGGSCH